MRTNELCPKKKVRPSQERVTKSERKNNFRKVMCTGPCSQLVVMSIPPGQEIGEETQEDIDQTLFIVAGQGEAVLDGNVTTVRQHDAVFVPAGTNRNLRNKGNGRLRLFTVYSRCRAAFIF
jgi:mannose-6-phosphate isomerase-like protein (cupin superfamily)